MCPISLTPVENACPDSPVQERIAARVLGPTPGMVRRLLPGKVLSLDEGEKIWLICSSNC